MKYKGIIISDIHIGALPLDKLKDELDKIFFKYISSLNKLDFLIINGDLFDKRLYLNDRNADYVMEFITKIKDICKDKGTKVRLIYGTESHENKQYSCISTIKNEIDIKVIYHVSEEELLPGLNVLYLPEEHIYDKNEYYKDYFSNENKYAYIFGHGIIRETMKEAAVISDNENSKRQKVPVFSTSEFRKICYGETYFGHYHTNTDMTDVFYVGSFSRWQFGEDEQKGFYEVTCNIDKKKFSHKFIENTLADVYRTVKLLSDDELFNDNQFDKRIEKIDDIIKADAIDHIRFIVNIPKEYENPEFLIEYLKSRYSKNKKVKLNIVDGYIQYKKDKEKKIIEEEENKYGFVRDDNLKIEEKVQKFIVIEYDRDIPLEKVISYMYKPLNEILKEYDV